MRAQRAHDKEAGGEIVWAGQWRHSSDRQPLPGEMEAEAKVQNFSAAEQWLGQLTATRERVHAGNSESNGYRRAATLGRGGLWHPCRILGWDSCGRVRRHGRRSRACNRPGIVRARREVFLGACRRLG